MLNEALPGCTSRKPIATSNGNLDGGESRLYSSGNKETEPTATSNGNLDGGESRLYSSGNKEWSQQRQVMGNKEMKR